MSTQTFTGMISASINRTDLTDFRSDGLQIAIDARTTVGSMIAPAAANIGNEKMTPTTRIANVASFPRNLFRNKPMID